MNIRVFYGNNDIVTQVDDLINVGVVFKGGVASPKWMRWRGRVIEVENIPMRYDGKDGDAPLTYYSLVSKTAVYGVVWNRKTNVWRLIEVKSD